MNVVQSLNDAFRCSFSGGIVILDEDVADLNEQLLMRVFDSVKTYDAFDQSDICDEHALGSFEIENDSYCWMIDYYSIDDGSTLVCDPTDTKNTVRVLTISKLEEYEDA